MPWNFPFLKRKKTVVGTKTIEQFELPPISGDRKFRQDVPYILPVDITEVSRLDFQHYILRATLKGNYLAPLEYPARILDVGCGTGRWAADMCQQFPQSQVIGIDLQPGQQSTPDNFLFLDANILNGIPFETGSFDFVHQRFLLSAITLQAWPNVIKDFVRVTRPGGWIELIEGTDEIVPCGPAMRQLLGYLGRLMALRGLDADGSVPRNLDKLMLNAGLQNVKIRTFDVPLGKWGGHIGTMMATNLYTALSPLSNPIHSYFNIPKAEIDHIIEQLQGEWEKEHATYRYYVADGQKPETS